MAGGNDSDNSAELFDPLNGTFPPTGSMAAIRLTHTATLLRDPVASAGRTLCRRLRGHAGTPQSIWGHLGARGAGASRNHPSRNAYLGRKQLL